MVEVAGNLAAVVVVMEAADSEAVDLVVVPAGNLVVDQVDGPVEAVEDTEADQASEEDQAVDGLAVEEVEDSEVVQAPAVGGNTSINRSLSTASFGYQKRDM
ncbi:hypothetical protein HA402_016057 [Bradysia odoriphaga]|nr:hypothetical protein HA402_016057 [Bradysia odoriphaga]